jgi:ubiquinone/menaquinone biosynthesis C-methylase UbiE
MSDDDFLQHYETGIEAARLAQGAGILERARTVDLLSRHLPIPPARILDVGGGPGVYAVWLAGLGYDVHLIDPVPLHVEQAQAAAERAGVALQASVGDARRLPEPEESVDAALVMGPLYHLIERSDRVAALAEARRVVRPGGVVVAVGISRYASLLDGLSRRLIDDPVFRSILDRDLTDGQHRNPTDRIDYFTTTFFHRVEELVVEAADAGLRGASVAAIEGPAWLLGDIAARVEDAAHWTLLMDTLRRIEAEPALLAVSAHLMLIAPRGGRSTTGAKERRRRRS